jgi:hypothetical protein
MTIVTSVPVVVVNRASTVAETSAGIVDFRAEKTTVRQEGSHYKEYVTVDPRLTSQPSR